MFLSLFGFGGIFIFLSFQKTLWYLYRFITFSVLVMFGNIAHYTQHLYVMHMVGLAFCVIFVLQLFT